MNNEVNKKNAELFEALFGSEMQSKEIKMKQMQERQLKPFTILVIEDLFAILKRIFTSIIPFAIILIKALNYNPSVNLYKYILTSGFKITLFAFCSYAALTVLDTLTTIVVGVIYSAIVAKRAKKMEFLKSKIKTKLEEQDKKDSEGIKEFSKDELDIINKAKELTKQYEEKIKDQKQTKSFIPKSMRQAKNTSINNSSNSLCNDQSSSILSIFF